MDMERRRKKEKEKVKEETKEEGRRWYGITSMGQHMQRMNAVLKTEGFNIFRKGGKKIEWQVKRND